MTLMRMLFRYGCASGAAHMAARDTDADGITFVIIS